jgi:hypothetical protein
LVKAGKIYAANSGSGADWLFFRKKKLVGKKDEVPPGVDLGCGDLSVLQKFAHCWKAVGDQEKMNMPLRKSTCVGIVDKREVRST